MRLNINDIKNALSEGTFNDKLKKAIAENFEAINNANGYINNCDIFGDDIAHSATNYILKLIKEAQQDFTDQEEAEFEKLLEEKEIDESFIREIIFDKVSSNDFEIFKLLGEYVPVGFSTELYPQFVFLHIFAKKDVIDAWEKEGYVNDNINIVNKHAEEMIL